MEQLIQAYNASPQNIKNCLNNSCDMNKHVDKIYIIHLKKDGLRGKYIELIMKKLNINYTLVEVAKPTKDLYCGLMRLMAPTTKKMSGGEAGCYLSHMWCLGDIIKHTYKNAIILEDDIVTHKNIISLYNDIVANNEYDFLMLGAADHGFNKGNKELIKNNVYIPKYPRVLGTHAIYYSQYGAKKMYEHRKNKPVYFDYDLNHVFSLFDAKKTGICFPNLFTVENSTTDLNHYFGITKYSRNDYYYNKCYSNFKFSDYNFIYLDLFPKYTLESIKKASKLTKRQFIKALLRNYFNNDTELVDYHVEKINISYFTKKEYLELLNVSRDDTTCLYYKNYRSLCKQYNVTSGTLIRKKLPARTTSISDLFYKQQLDPMIKDRGYIYNEVHTVSHKNRYAAHLHCFYLDDFSDIYQPYFEKISKHMDIIVTYCYDNCDNCDENDLFSFKNEILTSMLKRCTILKCENKGLDIGCKFIFVDYIKKKKLDYSYLLFLHSKGYKKTRELYFKCLIHSLDYILENTKTNTIGGFFPPTIHRGNNSSIVYDYMYMKPNDIEKYLYDPFKCNSRYVNALIKYFKFPENDITIWPSGNCYCLHTDVAFKLYGDYNIYTCLNYKTSPPDLTSIHCFDYNWVKLYYKIPYEDVEFVYELSEKHNYKHNTLQIENNKEQFRDGMIEHAFERLLFSAIVNTSTPMLEICILPNAIGRNKEKIYDISDKINGFYKNRILYDNFDYKKYLLDNKDLARKGLKTKMQLWKHWIRHGMHENRAQCRISIAGSQVDPESVPDIESESESESESEPPSEPGSEPGSEPEPEIE